MARKRICILSLSTIHEDGRVLRQIEHASKTYDVIVVGWGHLDRPRPGVKMLTVEPFHFSPIQRFIQAGLMLGGRIFHNLWDLWYWRKPDHRHALSLLLEHPCDLIHINEAIALPLGLKAADQTGAKVLFDAHEYSPVQRIDLLWWRILAAPYYRHLFRFSAHQAHAMITVAPGLATRYKEEYNLSTEVILNAPFYQPSEFKPTNPDNIRLIHHGVALDDRRLDRLIEVVALSDQRYTLDFMLVDSNNYINVLQKKASEVAPGRVKFRCPVSPEQIVKTLREYDVGLHVIPPTSFSYLHALPNKFFEAIMAGLAVIVGPSIEMATIVQRYQLGLVADNFEPLDVARVLNNLSSSQIDFMKKQSIKAASELNADQELARLLSMYAGLLQRP